MFSKFKSDLTITTSVVAVALMAISVSAAELEVIDTTQVVNPETFNAVDVLLNNGTLQFTPTVASHLATSP